jgi:hypothetical protein
MTARWGSLGQREMSPIRLVIGDAFIHLTPQVLFVEDDDMVEQIRVAAANPAVL